MIIGVPRERKTLEKRVALTPDGARELARRGHKVLIETNAGKNSFFEDESYREAGSTIISSLDEIWKRSELIVKVKEPHESEYQYFRPGITIFDYLHLASMPGLTKKMIEGKMTGIAFELVQDESGRHPLLDPMSEVAGKRLVL